VGPVGGRLEGISASNVGEYKVKYYHVREPRAQRGFRAAFEVRPGQRRPGNGHVAGLWKGWFS